MAVDERRFRVTPLPIEEKEKAGIGEPLIDRDTGDFYVKCNNGEVRSRTANIENIINAALDSDINIMAYAYNTNKRVYRLFFDENMVRLDTNLILDSSCHYYRIRSYSDDLVYYLATLTPIRETGALILPMKNNELYFVEFYNHRKELISMLPFSGKASISFIVEDTIIKNLSRIEIYTNKDFLYQNEDIKSLMIKVIAIYEDDTEKDITEYNNVSITHNINNAVIGDYEINASFIYDLEDNLVMNTSKQFQVVKDVYASIKDLIVYPKKIVNLNDGSREIRLKIVLYYEDGTTKDVSDECIVSNFDDELFNEEQMITVKVNAGHVGVEEFVIKFKVDDDGGASEHILYFNDENILELYERNDYPTDATKYRVRAANDLEFYFTLDYATLRYDSIYADSETGLELTTGLNVIVEFYNDDLELLDSDVYVCEYRQEL